ncbi:hypothetical protein [Nocardioides sp. Soil805]|uniref:hypothetical protein n=1 Tax=Nocardioides sp. Soil805 TaxID=1736416 RepID=UPI0007029B0A|nr:hypothetical protein [Nocardioides sp. Soil805]KRF34450.1 hypothetical protein ASG94_17375 [Nocardioides sp. Soil805]
MVLDASEVPVEGVDLVCVVQSVMAVIGVQHVPHDLESTGRGSVGMHVFRLPGGARQRARPRRWGMAAAALQHHRSVTTEVGSSLTRTPINDSV